MSTWPHLGALLVFAVSIPSSGVHGQQPSHKAFEGVVRYSTEYRYDEEDGPTAEVATHDRSAGMVVHWRAGSFVAELQGSRIARVTHSAGSCRQFFTLRGSTADTVYLQHLDDPAPDEVPLALVDIPGDTVILGHACRGMRQVYTHYDLDLWYAPALPLPAKAFKGCTAFGHEAFHGRAQGIVLLQRYRFTGLVITTRAVSIEPGPVDPALFRPTHKVELPWSLLRGR
jgi:hypothetical protein